MIIIFYLIIKINILSFIIFNIIIIFEIYIYFDFYILLVKFNLLIFLLNNLVLPDQFKSFFWSF